MMLPANYSLHEDFGDFNNNNNNNSNSNTISPFLPACPPPISSSSSSSSPSCLLPSSSSSCSSSSMRSTLLWRPPTVAAPTDWYLHDDTNSVYQQPLYKDNSIIICPYHIEIKYYYFPMGTSKLIYYKDIESVSLCQLSWFNRRYWGSNLFNNIWWQASSERRGIMCGCERRRSFDKGEDTDVIIKVDNSNIRIGVTPRLPDKAARLIADQVRLWKCAFEFDDERARGGGMPCRHSHIE
eukprot:GHVQ01041924.1.p1 GENE.GHVQ01041924.1~~GHVQ01041924.1.p1  ORF type:complete len:239 (-),score=49.19 GHVQ01041924.1:466-1182(-)